MRPYEVAYEHHGYLIGDEPLIDGTDVVTGDQATGYKADLVIGASFGDIDRTPYLLRSETPVVSAALRWAMLADAAPGARVWLTKSFAWHITQNSAERLGELYEKPERKASGSVAWGCLAWPDRLFEALRSPVSSDRCVSVPDGGQIHVLPWIGWGQVATDRWAGAWTSRDVEALETMVRLKELGLTENLFSLPEPPAYTAIKLGIPYAELLEAWEVLERWRATPQRMLIGLKATRKRKEIASG